ncbi:MAG: outer membrane beta-barrel protein [Gemmatimonadota bacterium]|nr:MAG: outer membrane beta-barrel protein [Gemmatimonadota bacterium]
MKTLAAATLVLLVLTSPALGQRQYVGLTGGATLSDFGNTTSGSRWGGVAGIAAGFRNYNWSVINLEATWTQRGDENIRLDYIDIPLLIGGVARAGSDIRTRFYAGIDVAFKIGCNAGTVVFNCDNAKGTQWFLPFGVMIGKWKTRSTYFGIDVRYLLGLSDTFETSNIWSRGWQFRVNVGRSVGQ